MNIEQMFINLNIVLLLINLIVMGLFVFRYTKLKKPKYYGVVINKNTNQTMGITNIEKKHTHFKFDNQTYPIEKDRFIKLKLGIQELNIMLYNQGYTTPIKINDFKDSQLPADYLNNILEANYVKQLTDLLKQIDTKKFLPYLIYGAVGLIVVLYVLPTL